VTDLGSWDRIALDELASLLGSVWDLHAADPPGTLRPWPVSEVLAAPVHDVFCRRTPSSSWAFQFMVDDTDGDDWLFRRDHRVRRPVASLPGAASRPGLPVLAPEVQLLYKSGVAGGSGPRPKDEVDLDHLGPVLDDAQRAWLVGSLSLLEPDHPWLRRLR
jgi:hypothetical protein